MAETKMEELAQQLLSQTKARKVEWEKFGRRGETEFRLVFPGGYFTIYEGDGHRLILGDLAGTVTVLDSEDFPDSTETLEEIYRLAEEQIKDRGIEKAFEFLKNR